MNLLLQCRTVSSNLPPLALGNLADTDNR